MGVGMKHARSELLINAKNVHFLQGKRTRLAHRREVLENLAGQIGVPKQATSSLVGCQAMVLGGAGAVASFVGVFMLVMLMRTVGVSRLGWGMATDDWALWVFFLVGSVLLIAYVGYRYIVQAILIRRYAQYLARLYEALLQRGRLAEGRILNIGCRPNGARYVRYAFVVSVSGSQLTYEGEYTSYAQRPLEVGEQVIVLYVNRCVHILL